MTTCQECASEISEIEVFCPYCGIKIDRPSASPEPAPPKVVDESFDSTLVISSEEASAMRQNFAAAEPAADPIEQISEPPPSPSGESGRPMATVENIPTPAILEEPGRLTDPGVSFDEESTPTKETPVYSESTAPEVELPAAFEIPEVSEPAPLTPDQTAAVVNSPLEPPSEPLVEEPVWAKDDEPEWAREDSQAPSWDVAAPVAEPDPVFTVPEPEPTFTAPEPEVVSEVPVESSPVAAEVPAASVPASYEEPVDFPVVAAPDVEPPSLPVVEPPAEEPAPIQAEAEIPVVTGISKPLDEPVEPDATPSVFDSVRIMEGEGLGPDTSADTVIPGRHQEPEVVELAPEVPAVASVPVEPTPAPKPADHSTGSVDSDGRRSAKLKPLPEGTVLNNRYEIVRKIGGGGMGAVYLASDNNLGGVLRAVKEMVQAHIEEDQQEKAINDFKRESTILSTLDHPSIPTIYDYFYDGLECRFYLVMKYISGGDLASKLRTSPDGKVDELTITEWAIQLTDVLNYLHNQPTTIVYRDLKPSNIMLDGNSGRVMVIDFGIARSITQKEEKGVTAVGTMGYAPPELFSGNVEPRSDIYSLGSTMFHLMTGADPQSNPLLIFDFQKNPRPRQINSRLSDQMERILMKMVEYNAEQRFSSAAELKATLEDHLANLRTGNLTFGVTEAPISVSLANQTVFCGFCGQRIVATDLFCAFCGAKQPLAQKGVHSEIYQTGAVTARLVVEGTSDLSAPIYALQKDDNLIGRRDPMSNIFPEVDLSKYDPQTKISRRHAKIWRDGTAFMLEDLGSSNGTVVEGPTANNLKLPAHQPYKLTSGDLIKIGDTKLHFVVG